MKIKYRKKDNSFTKIKTKCLNEEKKYKISIIYLKKLKKQKC